jgi:hypothetical protein
MDKAMVPPGNVGATRLRRLALLLLALLVLAAVAVQLWSSNGAGQREMAADGIPLNPAMEERFGVRITGLHVVARGGLIDLRYRVVDAGKAKIFGHYTETSPMIIAEESGLPVEVTIMGLHNHRVETGRIYYILYRNTADALEPGALATIQIDDLTLEHVPVQ